ncbi:hypothetical protein VTO42DRAFT_539 [Malbranchea cinnamomea]
MAQEDRIMEHTPDLSMNYQPETDLDLGLTAERSEKPVLLRTADPPHAEGSAHNDILLARTGCTIFQESKHLSRFESRHRELNKRKQLHSIPTERQFELV